MSTKLQSGKMLTDLVIVLALFSTVRGSRTNLQHNCSCDLDCTKEIYGLSNHKYKFNFTKLIHNAGMNILTAEKLKVEFGSERKSLFTKQFECGGNCSLIEEISMEVILTQKLYEAKIISETGCQVTKFHVNFLGNDSVTCSESGAKNPRPSMQMYAEESGRKILCAPNTKALEDFLYTNQHAITVRWYKNCNVLSESNWKDGEYLNIQKVSLTETPGTYSCEIKIQNKTFFIMHRPVCVRPHYTDFALTSTITASNATATVNQREVTLRCAGEMAQSPEEMFAVSWVRLPGDVEVCYSFSMSDDQNCSMVVQPNPCYYHPNEDVLPKFTSSFEATYTLRDVTADDVGEYQCRLQTFKQIVSASVHVTVKDNAKLWVIIGCLAVLTLLTLICTLTIHIFWIEVRYLWKKYFKDEIPADFDKPYVVYLSYNYDNSLAAEMKGNVREAVTALHDQLHKLDCSYYDPAMPSDVEYEIVQVGQEIVPAAKKVLGKCHCFMMILTDSAVQDDEWTKELTNILALTKNAIEDIEIVFLCTPTAQKVLTKRAAEGHKTSIAFKQFMSSRKNFVIKWKVKKMKSARFYKALYIALPKVEKNSVVPNSYIV